MEANPNRNALGAIAENYDALHGMSQLRHARDWATGQPSRHSALRSILQTAEVALLNLSDLTRRTALDVAAQNLEQANLKLGWIVSFHRLLSLLAHSPSRFGVATAQRSAKEISDFRSSPALAEYLKAVRDYDATILSWIDGINIPLDALLSNGSLSDIGFGVLHRARIAAHESEIWEELLVELDTGLEQESFGQWVRSAELRAMVYDSELLGETYYMQFRALHQIPEILADEANAHVAVAAEMIAARKYRPAHESMTIAIATTEGIIAAMPPIIDCLATTDYHRIRENLGVSSGIYSRTLHDSLFGQTYKALLNALNEQVRQFGKASGINGGLANAIEAIESARLSNADAWDLHLLLNFAGLFRSQIDRWRAYHLALPRHNLGSGPTRSMVGSMDAVQTVERLRDAAKTRDAASFFGTGQDDSSRKRKGPLGVYFRSADSLASRLLAATGVATRDRFPDVQARTGASGGGCPYSTRRSDDVRSS